jgi:hypothetical protein
MSVKTYICKSLEYAPKSEIDTIEGTTITLLSGFTMRSLPARETLMEETLDKGAPGPSVKQTMTIVCDESYTTLNEIKHRDLVFKLNLSTGGPIIFGSLQYPVRFDDMKKEFGAQKIIFIRLCEDLEF